MFIGLLTFHEMRKICNQYNCASSASLLCRLLSYLTHQKRNFVIGFGELSASFFMFSLSLVCRWYG